MAKSYSGFISETGRVFDTEFEAWREDFRVWLRKYGIDNDPIAAKIVANVADGCPESLDTLAAIVNGLKRSAPAPKPKVAAGDPASADGWAPDIADPIEAVPAGDMAVAS